MRHLLASVAFAPAAVALAAPFHGPGPVAEFPASFADQTTVHVFATATYRGRTVRQTQRVSYDDTLVFDDATRLRFEAGLGAPFDIEATWKPLSKKVVSFRYTPQTLAAVKEYLNDTSGLPSRVSIGVGRGRLEFVAGGTKYRGSQVINAATTYRGARISIVEVVGFRGVKQ